MAIKRHVSLGFVSPADSRKPKFVLLQVEDFDHKIITRIMLKEHDFVALLSGQSVAVEAEI